MSTKIWTASLLTLGLIACAESPSKPAPAPAKPAPVAAKPAVVTQPSEWAVVNDWAAAWSARNTDKYLAAYAPDFKPEKGTRADWEKQRKERIGKAKKIEVTVSDIKIKQNSATSETATFMQSYKSDSHADKGMKSLDLQLVGGKWLITREYTAHAVPKAKAKPAAAPAAAAKAK